MALRCYQRAIKEQFCAFGAVRCCLMLDCCIVVIRASRFVFRKMGPTRGAPGTCTIDSQYTRLLIGGVRPRLACRKLINKLACF